MPPAPESQLPEIPGLRLSARIGGGWSGEVYRGLVCDGSRPVAVKVLGADRLDDPIRRARFAREAELLARHPHPAIVPLVASDLSGPRPWIAFAWMPGGDLARHTRAPSLLPTSRVLETGARLASALDHLHLHGVVHRDLKPANVLLDAAGLAHLGDLGLGKDLGAGSLTASGEVVGTWLYMAPEVEAGEPAGPASDRWSLATMLVELLCGRLPCRRGTGSELPAEFASLGLGADLAGELRALLLTEAEDRPTSLAGLAQALAEVPRGATP